MSQDALTASKMSSFCNAAFVRTRYSGTNLNDVVGSSSACREGTDFSLEKTVNITRLLAAALITAALSTTAFAQTPSVKIVLPERIRLLQGQYVDLVLEVRNATTVSGLKVTAGGDRPPST